MTINARIGYRNSKGSMSIHEAYTAWSATYDSDRNLTRDLDQRVTREVLGVQRYPSILEIGCGTGKNTTFLAQIGDQVHATDFSAGMLQRAKAKVRNANVTFALADLTQPWCYVDGAADLVVCNLVLEHIAGLSFVFGQAARCLGACGRFFICELHPFKQYQGSKANFQRRQERVEIEAHLHHISAFLDAAGKNGFTLNALQEWWHEEDQNKPPRLVSFLFEKPAS